MMFSVSNILNCKSLATAREAVASALRAHRTLRQTIRETNGTRPSYIAAIADSLGIERPDGLNSAQH